MILTLTSENLNGPVISGASSGGCDAAGSSSDPNGSGLPGTATARSILQVNLGKALAAVAPRLTQVELSGWTQALAVQLPKAAIIPPRCVAAFLGQCAVESGGFRELEEDLCYSADRLCEVWPNRFQTLKDAQPFAFQPEALANDVYAGRMGNGDTASGDGWRFRGRGLIQLTGRAAYERFATSVGMTLDDAVQHAATPPGAVETAIWFWSEHDLNALAEQWMISRITLRINGSMTGDSERVRLCDVALSAIGF
jgi:putative chitinase